MADAKYKIDHAEFDEILFEELAAAQKRWAGSGVKVVVGVWSPDEQQLAEETRKASKKSDDKKK